VLLRVEGEIPSGYVLEFSDTIWVTVLFLFALLVSLPRIPVNSVSVEEKLVALLETVHICDDHC
jgi:hypothetical protein